MGMQSAVQLRPASPAQRFLTATLSTAVLVLQAAIAFAGEDQPVVDQPSTRPVTVTGELQTGLMAIGGETTGTIIRSQARTYELDFADNVALQKQATGWSGKTVVVTGPLRRVRGVEVRDRWIIAVTKLSLPDADGQSTRISIHPGNDQVHLEIHSLKTGLSVEIVDTVGIGSAKIVRNTETWPDPLQLVFRLKGLEQCRITSGTTTLEWSIASSPPFAIRQSVTTEKNPSRTLEKGDSLFAEIEPVEGKGFQMTIPSAFLKTNSAPLHLRWIDFYR